MRTKERKRRKGFCKVAFFFLSSFFVCFLKVFSTCDFGPNLVVFLCFGDSITFEFLKFLNVIFKENRLCLVRQGCLLVLRVSYENQLSILGWRGGFCINKSSF